MSHFNCNNLFGSKSLNLSLSDDNDKLFITLTLSLSATFTPHLSVSHSRPSDNKSPLITFTTIHVDLIIKYFYYYMDSPHYHSVMFLAEYLALSAVFFKLFFFPQSIEIIQYFFIIISTCHIITQ